ncbi:hypothetical protein ACM0P6_05980 [Komagataeibacter sucrofermentans]|nr:hypothetical protein [Komagataeibacter sucrofermentans]
MSCPESERSASRATALRCLPVLLITAKSWWMRRLIHFPATAA